MPGAEIIEIDGKHLEYINIFLLTRDFFGIGEIIHVDFFYIMQKK